MVADPKTDLRATRKKAPKEMGGVAVRPGYKQTEVGVIPEGWELIQLASIGKFSKGQGVRKDEAQGGDISCVRYGEIYTHHNDIIRQFNSHISPAVALGSKRLKKGDLLFAGSGETKEEIGKCVAFVFDQEAYAGGDIIVLSPHKGDPCFFGYLLNSPLVVKQKATRGQGDAIVHIGINALSEIKIPFPPTVEQEGIAKVLSEIDALILSLDGLVAKKRALKLGAMQELLTGKRRLPGFSDEWETRPYSETLVRLNAKAYQIQTHEYQNSGKYPVVDQGKEAIVGFSDLEEKRFRCPIGGVIVFGDHTCIVKFVDFDFLVGADGTQILKGKPGLNTRFLALKLQYVGVESTGYNRHFKFLKERNFVVPSIAEQEAIANVFSDMDAEISAFEARRDKAKALKSAMMHELLTGNIRLCSK